MACEPLASVQAEIEEMERGLADDIQDLRARWDTDALELEEVEIAPRKADLQVERMSLVWVPFAEEPDGRHVPLHRPG